MQMGLPPLGFEGMNPEISLLLKPSDSVARASSTARPADAVDIVLHSTWQEASWALVGNMGIYHLGIIFPYSLKPGKEGA